MRVRAVKEGKTAVQAASRAVSHTIGSTKVLSNTPDEKHTEKSNLFTGMMTHHQTSIKKTFNYR